MTVQTMTTASARLLRELLALFTTDERLEALKCECLRRGGGRG